MSRTRWIALQVFAVTAESLVFAAITRNENWPLNIPLGIICGTLFGVATWPLYRRGQR
jgi:hypothetical protein